MYNILCLILGVLIGYRVGEYKIYTQKQSLIDLAGRNAQLDAKIERYEKYVPKTEIKKNQIIRLHYSGFSSREIGGTLKIDSSAITRALKRWNIK